MIDVFVLVSGTFSIVATVPLLYLAVRSLRDARGLRTLQYELAHVVRETREIGEEVHRLQREIRNEQDVTKSELGATKQTVEQVSEVVHEVHGQASRRRLRR